MVRESRILFLLVLLLALLGLLAVYSASAADAGAAARAQREIVYVFLGFCAMMVASNFDYHQLRSPVIFRALVTFSLILLVAVLIPGVGVVHNGARRWIEIGPLGFQPAEIAKFALILLLAVKLSANREEVRTFWRGLVPPLLISGIFTGLIVLQKDLGTPVVLGSVAVVMMFVAGVRLRFLIPGLLPVAGIVAWLALTSPHRVRRLTSFLDPWAYQSDEGYQLVQSMTAFAQGSLWGRGAGAGQQKLHFLPEPHTDFIFAVWGEEMGLAGTMALVSLFVILLVVASRVAMHARDLFGTLLATGILGLVTIQAGVNMGVTTGLLPTKGLPLPFVSWGGTSLLVFMTMMGVLVNIGLHARAPERKHGLAVVPA